jgi:hypothetical protein
MTTTAPSTHVPQDGLRQVIATARELARYQRVEAVTTTHLLLAIMRESPPWAVLIADAGGWTYAAAALHRGRFGLLPPAPPSDVGHPAPTPVMRSAPKRFFWLLLTSLVALVLWIVRSKPPMPPEPALSDRAREAVALAIGIARAQPASEGHLLVVLCATPGKHISLLENPQLVGAYARRRMGLARMHHRIMVFVDWPAKKLRRLVRAAVVHRRRRHGLAALPWFGLVAGFWVCGVSWGIARFTLETLSTIALLPSLLLANGLRVGVASALNVDIRIRRLVDLPGGESDVSADDPTMRKRAVLAILAPRALCFVISVVTFLVVIWNATRLGVEPFPTTFVRLDHLRTVAYLPGPFGAPLLLAVDGLEHRSWIAGVGLLAGVGASILALPSYREVQTVRLMLGHDLGQGTWIGRAILWPALVLTGILAVVEAFLPWRNGPVYVTVYVVPLGLAFGLAALLSTQLPY